MKALFFIILSLSLSISTFAGCAWYDISDCSIGLFIDGWSVHHVDNNTNYNERQNTKGIRIDHFGIITFDNSFDNSGQAGFVVAPISVKKYHQFGLLFALFYGYENYPIPALLPYVQIRYETLAVNISCLSAIDGTEQYICGFILEIVIQ
jgi:hypothetical protein